MHYRSAPLPISLSESTPVENIPTKVQLMRECTFYHERYGKVEITKTLFEDMIRNFSEKIRGIDVMIDYSHESEREAAGWIKTLEVILNEERNEHELWAIVEWTPKGRKTLSDKEYAYLSADFDPDYRDNENPTMKYGAVLLGAGLTNRPVIKRMSPAIELSEYSYKQESKENLMDDKVKELEEEKKVLQEVNGDMSAKLEKVSALMKELGVEDMEDLMKVIAELRASNVEMKEKAEYAEKEKTLSELFAKGKISEAQKEKAIKLSGESFSSFVELAEMNKGIKTEEIGHSETKKNEAETKDVAELVDEKARKLSEEKKIDYIAAVSMVLSENEELKNKYYEL